MIWYQLFKRTTPHERREIALLMLRRIQARGPNPLLLRFVAYMETPSKVRFIIPLLVIQGISLLIGLGLGSGLGLLLMLVVSGLLVGLAALHASALSKSSPIPVEG